MRTELTEPTTGAGSPGTGVTAPVGVGASPAQARTGALARLVGSDVDAFAGEHWGTAPLFHATADCKRFADLLDLDWVDGLLSYRGLRTPFLQLARNGSVIDSTDFTGPGGVGAEIPDHVRDDRVAAWFAYGSTVVLQALHRTRSAFVDVCTALAEDPGHPVQANSYVTPPQSQGFSVHYDEHDVLVLQLAGLQHWRVHVPVIRDPLRSQPWARRGDAVATLRPGRRAGHRPSSSRAT